MITQQQLVALVFSIISLLGIFFKLVIFRIVSLPDSRESLDENSEYVMVNKITGMLQYYDAKDIPSQIASILGISVLVLREESLCLVGKDVRHGVLHTAHVGQPCFVASRLEDGLCLALYAEHELRFNRKGRGSGCGYHGLVVPVDAMTLDDFIARFSRYQSVYVDLLREVNMTRKK
jgi:hypothetical protein